MKTPKKTNTKNVDVLSLPKKRVNKKTVKKNTSIINEVLEAFGLGTSLIVTSITTVKDLPAPNIEKASNKFGFAISVEDKVIDIANKIQKWYN